ncbi:hypothetical protein [Nocardiopsis sp. YSL2]|uniref:hypothetical protein n=1 Tax=Nocardiopsis sp. YSL2 TaxID=2939492 RepID=UPI0026F461EC|nr:hypothetical protein [Nocardiopsis sp. YSL2]
MAKQPRDYLRWDLLDRTEDPVPWSVGDVRSLKDFYEKLADAADQAATDMRRLEGDKLGEGDTVSALKELVNELPKHLDKAQDAYEGGYKALDKWMGALEQARRESAVVARQASDAYLALEDTEAWKEKVDGDDPVRDAHIRRLDSVLSDMNVAAEECKNALDEAKQGNPNELWGWLDAVVTWVEENPLIYAVAMVVVGLAAIFIPGLGIALALAALSISAATLHREGKLGFNPESLFTLGMDAVALIPGGALLRGGRAASRAVGAAATRVPGRVGSRVTSAATAVRNSGAARTVTSAAGRVNRARNAVTSTRTGNIAYSVTRDTSASFAASVSTQMIVDGKSLSEFGGEGWGHEIATAFATSVAGATVSAVKAGPTPVADPGGGAADPVTVPDGGGSDSGPTPDGGGPDSNGAPSTSGSAATAGGPDSGGTPDNPGTPDSSSGTPSGSSEPTPDFGDASTPTPSGAGNGPQGSTTPEFSDASGPQTTASPSGANDGGDPTPQSSDASRSPDTATGDGPQGSTTPEFSDTPSTRDADGPRGEGGDSTREEPAPTAPSGGVGDIHRAGNRPLNQPGDLDAAGSPRNQSGPPDTADSSRGPNSDQNRSPDQSPDQRGSQTPDGSAQHRSGDDTTTADPSNGSSPDTARPGDGHSTPRQFGPDRGEYSTTRGPDGERTVNYRYSGSGEGGRDFTMDVSRDGVNVGGSTVRRTDDGFGVTAPDGSSATTGRHGEGSVDLTGPGGRPGASYRDNEVTVPTGGGDVTVSRNLPASPDGADGPASSTRGPGRPTLHNDDGPTIRTGDGLYVTRVDDAGQTRINHTGDGPVDLRFDGQGPEITRPAPDGSASSAPRTRVSDPVTGRTTEIGVDGYRVDTPDGTSHSYDRGTDTVSVDSGGTRVEASPGSVRVSDDSRGVDLWQSRDGVGQARGAGSDAIVRGDGSAELRTNNATLAPRATQDAQGNVTIGDTRTSPGQVRTDNGTDVRIAAENGVVTVQVRGDDGMTRVYDTEGRPMGPYPPLRPDPATGRPSVVTDGTRVTLTPGSTPGPSGYPAPALRVETAQGWTVTTGTDGEVSVRTPADGRGDSLEISRLPDGSTGMRSGDHSVASTPGGQGADTPSRVEAHGPDGVQAGTTTGDTYVSDGSTRTDVRTGPSSGLGSGTTRSATEPYGPYAGQDGRGGRVETGDGITVRTSGDEVQADVPHRDEDGGARTVRNGDRTIEAGADRTSMSGPDPDSGRPAYRPGEQAGDAGRVPPGWRVGADGDSMSGRTHPEHEINVSRDPNRLARPFRDADEVAFRSGDVDGRRTPSGRTEMTDGQGSSIRDGRGGVRVDGGDGRPDLRITDDHVRVTAPDGSQQRVDIPDRSDGSGTTRRRTARRPRVPVTGPPPRVRTPSPVDRTGTVTAVPPVRAATPVSRAGTPTPTHPTGRPRTGPVLAATTAGVRPATGTNPPFARFRTPGARPWRASRSRSPRTPSTWSPGSGPTCSGSGPTSGSTRRTVSIRTS